MSPDPLRTAARALQEAVEAGEERDGGLITRETLRLASLLRIELDAAQRRAAQEVCDLQKATDLSAVLVEPDGVLKASSIAAVINEGLTDIGIIGLDGQQREFVRMPMAPPIARLIATEMLRLAEMAEASGEGGT